VLGDGEGAVVGEFFGCDPERLRALTDKLSTAAETVAQRAPTIRDTMSGWGSPMSFQLLLQEATRLSDDARAMARRADLALAIDDMPKITAPGANTAWLSGVPWDPTDVDVARGAGEDARRLKNALDNPDEPWAREAIREVGQSLEDHKDDPAYLQAFFAGGGAAQIARVPRQLHEQDGTDDLKPLSEESERIIGQYANALASATKLATDGRLPLPPQAFQPILRPPNDDMWSSAMLLQYGPPGDRYDPQFLADMGRSVLDWRAAHPARPSFSPGMVTSAGYVSGGYVDPDHAWYSSLGLETNYLHKNAEDAQANLDAIRANDPALAVLGRLGENADAARNLLSGDDGLKRARQLVDENWGTPGYVFTDEGEIPGKVLYVAAADRSAAHAEQSGRAAAHIFQAASDNYAAGQHRSDYDKEQYPHLPASLAKSLAAVASGYVIDLARSTDTPNIPTIAGKQGDAWMVQTNPDVVDGLLHEIMFDPDAAGALQGAVDAHTALATRARAHGGDGTTPADLENLGRLTGFFAQTRQDIDWDPAQARDEANARSQVYLNAVSGALGNAPVTSPALGWAQAALGFATPIAADALFPTDNAANVEETSDREMYGALNSFRPQVAEGLLAAGKISPPDHAVWLEPNGRVKFDNPDEKAAFELWWHGLPAEYTNYENVAQTGFQEGTTKHSPNDDAHKPDHN
jgi:hypothetical protein